MYEKKWYLQTWFIALLAALWMFFFPPLIAIGLIIAQNEENKKIMHEKKTFDDYVADNAARKASLNAQLDDLNLTIADCKAKVDSLGQQELSLNETISGLHKEIDSLISETFTSQYVFADYDALTSEECKNKLTMLKIQEKELIKSGDALIVTTDDAKKTVNNNIKQILRCFNAECDNILLNATVKNIDTLRGKVQKTYETLNSIFATDGVKLSADLLNIKLEELNLVYTAEIKKEQEKEIQKAIKEQMKEEQKAERELEKAKAQIEKDAAQFSGEINKLMAYLNKTESDVEKQLYVDKIKELENRLKDLEDKKKDVIHRQENAKAGFVYVISNIGSFGENIYKIGMTRRLEPMDRIKELSSASVPFEFDVHAMIFSDNAPALEADLHNHFDKNRVNKVNPRKEFFNLNIDDIESYVKENFNNTVSFTKIPLATEYKQSLNLAS